MNQPDPSLHQLEQQVISFFVDGVRILGLPNSIGEIYGILFISQTPLSLDDLVDRLQISKGSASQGIRMLKNLGAIHTAPSPDPSLRKTYYEPAVELKRLVGGFIREQITPHIRSGSTKLTSLKQQAESLEHPDTQQFAIERISRLQHWLKTSGKILPVIQKLLGQ